MKIRPGGPGDIAAVLALGDEAVEWMNARGSLVRGYEKYGFSRVQEFTVALTGPWPGMLLAMRLPRH